MGVDLREGLHVFKIGISTIKVLKKHYSVCYWDCVLLPWYPKYKNEKQCNIAVFMKIDFVFIFFGGISSVFVPYGVLLNSERGQSSVSTTRFETDFQKQFWLKRPDQDFWLNSERTLPECTVHSCLNHFCFAHYERVSPEGQPSGQIVSFLPKMSETNGQISIKFSGLFVDPRGRILCRVNPCPFQLRQLCKINLFWVCQKHLLSKCMHSREVNLYTLQHPMCAFIFQHSRHVS